jgi:ribosomal protein S18 acetylase RimI-like enzyme
LQRLFKGVTKLDNSSLFLRFALKPGEDKRIREITESVGVFHPYEVDIAEELAIASIEAGPEISGYNYILCEYDSEIIGYACYGEIPCTKDRYDFYWLVVYNSFRRMDIGKKLISATEEEILKRGGKKLYIETSSGEPYYYTRQFYVNRGYKQEAVFKDFYDDGDDKVVYVKSL